MNLLENQTCNECGRSVAFGSGNFVKRVFDANSKTMRRKMGKPYPNGDYVCAECGEKDWHDEMMGEIQRHGGGG